MVLLTFSVFLDEELVLLKIISPVFSWGLNHSRYSVKVYLSSPVMVIGTDRSLVDRGS